MARSVTISGSTSDFSGAESVAAGEGRKIRFMENKNCSFSRTRNDAVFFGKQRRHLFESRQVWCRILYLLNPFNSGRFANRVNQRKQRDA
jgi:hypothetical protein